MYTVPIVCTTGNDTCRSHSAFKCGNGKCVHEADRCNGQDDCGNNEDEKQCGQSYVSVSVNVEFKATLHEQVRYRSTLPY